MQQPLLSQPISRVVRSGSAAGRNWPLPPMPRVLSAALDRHAISACLRDPAGRLSPAVRLWAAPVAGLPDVPPRAGVAPAEHAPPAAAAPAPDAVPEEARAADASPAAGARGLHEAAEAAAPHGRFAAAVAVVQHAVAAPAWDGRPVAAAPCAAVPASLA